MLIFNHLVDLLKNPNKIPKCEFSKAKNKKSSETQNHHLHQVFGKHNRMPLPLVKHLPSNDLS